MLLTVESACQFVVHSSSNHITVNKVTIYMYLVEYWLAIFLLATKTCCRYATAKCNTYIVSPPVCEVAKYLPSGILFLN